MTALCLLLTRADRRNSEKPILNCVLVPSFLQALMLGWCVAMWDVCVREHVCVSGVCSGLGALMSLWLTFECD